MSTFQKLIVKDLPCLFAELVEKYNEVGLKACETKESQKWRHASNQETAKHLTLYHNYLPELSKLHSVLESYSICEKHYNQQLLPIIFIDILQVLSKRINDCDSVLTKLT